MSVEMILEERLAQEQAHRAEAERERDEAVKDLREAHARLDVVQRELGETRKRYYEVLGRYDTEQIQAVGRGPRG